MKKCVKDMFKMLFKSRSWFLNLAAIVCAIAAAVSVATSSQVAKDFAAIGWICAALWAFNAWVLEAEIKSVDDQLGEDDEKS